MSKGKGFTVTHKHGQKQTYIDILNSKVDQETNRGVDGDVWWDACCGRVANEWPFEKRLQRVVEDVNQSID